jgi:ubiquinone/menaquinone biosynthesis C-methylase UbiE
MKIKSAFKKYIDHQYEKPSGVIGSFIGEKMVKQHIPETYWTTELLALKKDETILEIGCGAGKAIKLLLKDDSVRHIDGLDISKTVLKSARLRNRSEIKKKRASFVHGKANSLPFQDRQFSRIFSIHSLYFWDSIPDCAMEMHRVLKDNGMIVLTLSNGKDGEEWSNINSLVLDKLIPALKETGFKKIEVIKGPNSRQYHIAAIRAHK